MCSLFSWVSYLKFYKDEIEVSSFPVIHILAHVHEFKCFFLFLINFMALKIPLTGTSVITFYNLSKQND